MGGNTTVHDGPDNVVNLMDETEPFLAVMRAVNDQRYVFGLYDVNFNEAQFVVMTDMGVMRAVWPPDTGPLPFITQHRTCPPAEVGEEFLSTLEEIERYGRANNMEYIFFTGDQFDEGWL